MPSPAFDDLFDSEHPREYFRAGEEGTKDRENLRRTASRWYHLGELAHRNTQKEWCNLCGRDHYTDIERKQCGSLYNSTKNDKE